MARKLSILSAALFAATIAAAGSASGAPLQAAGSAIPEKTFAIGEGDASGDLIVKTQGRRGGGGGIRGGGGGGRFVGGGGRGGRFVGGGRGIRGGGWGRGGGGWDPGAAAAVGIIGGVLGAMGAAAAADQGGYAAPVYGGCYWVRRPVYDDWGNYLGRRRVRVCD